MKLMTSKTQRCATALALAALTSFAAQANTVLSSQAPRPDGALYLSNPANQNAESFQLGYAASISGIRWFGTTADVGSFTVRLFGGDLVANPDVFTTPLSIPGATLVRSANPVMTIGGGFVPAFEVFQYDLTLGSAFTTAANEKVYVSIFTDLATDWGWLDSAEGDGNSAFRSADGTAWNLSAPDLSLAVIGVTAVPEPGTYALMLGGLAVVAGVSRRRRRKLA